MSRTINVGVIGYGLAGRAFHTPFIEASPDFSLQMIATGDPTRQEDASRRYPGATIVPSPEELLSRASDLDLVVLATPAHTHRDLGTAAFAAGAAVVVDKPFALAADDAAALARAVTGVLADRGAREALSRAGRERARLYDWSAVGHQVASAYETVRSSHAAAAAVAGRRS